MKISVNWMQQLAGDVKIMPKGGIDELVKKIGAQLGAVEEVIDLGKKYQGIVIAKVVECEKHPNADKLHVCKIDDGGVAKGVKRDAKGLVQVVCGAPNVHADMMVAWLPPGTTVPSGYEKDPFVLEARELRGVVSNGMLASASELALGDDHSGILEIENPGVATHKDPNVDINDHVAAMQNIEFKRKHKPGDDFAKAFALDDYIIDIENKMFTHRPDCFGMLGVAREIAGITGQKFTSPKIYMSNKTTKISSKGLKLTVKNNIPNKVPRFMAQVFENVTVEPSPVWMQTYLSRLGVRPINNLVDITNYFMLLTGQPMHAYDYDKLCKVADTKTAQLETRLSKKGDKLALLNGKEIKFDDDSTILITSADKPVGIGGVMGGADTEVDEHTKNIVLECANFDMFSIRRTSMKYGLFTDAVTRFNKGQSPLQCDRVLAWAEGEVICDAGGEPGVRVDERSELKSPSMVRITTSFINERLGEKLSTDDIQALLENVEFSVERTDNKEELKVTPPFWRTDIEIREDIMEEVGRLYGYDHLPLELPKRDLTPAARDALLEFKDNLRDILSDSGANEVLTYSFVHSNLLKKSGQDAKEAFRLSNAISPDLQYYRLSLTPSLLDKIYPNIRAGYDEFAMFEIGKSHNKTHSKSDGVPDEFEMTALVYAAKGEKSGSSAGASYYRARTILDQIANRLGLEFVYSPVTGSPEYAVTKPFDPKRSAYVMDKATQGFIGTIGEFTSAVRKNFKLSEQCAGFELGTEDLFKAAQKGKTRRYEALPKFPKVDQDITLKCESELAYGELKEYLVNELDKLVPESTKYSFMPKDIFQKEGDLKHKSVTFRLQIAAYNRTLTTDEVNKLLDDLAAKAKTKFGAVRV